MIGPQVLHDPKHPAVEPRARRELVEPGQGAFAGALHEIVAVVDRSGQGIAEAPEPGQKADEFQPDLLKHRRLPRRFRPITRSAGDLFRSLEGPRMQRGVQAGLADRSLTRIRRAAGFARPYWVFRCPT